MPGWAVKESGAEDTNGRGKVSESDRSFTAGVGGWTVIGREGEVWASSTGDATSAVDSCPGADSDADCAGESEVAAATLGCDSGSDSGFGSGFGSGSGSGADCADAGVAGGAGWGGAV